MAEEVDPYCPIIDSVFTSFPAKKRTFTSTVFSDTATETSEGTKELPIVSENICTQEELIVNEDERIFHIEQKPYENHVLEVPDKQREFKIIQEKPINREKVFIEIAKLSRELDWLSLEFYKSEFLLKTAFASGSNIPLSKYITEHPFLHDSNCSNKNKLEYTFLKNVLKDAENNN